MEAPLPTHEHEEPEKPTRPAGDGRSTRLHSCTAATAARGLARARVPCPPRLHAPLSHLGSAINAIHSKRMQFVATPCCEPARNNWENRSSPTLGAMLVRRVPLTSMADAPYQTISEVPFPHLPSGQPH